MYRKSTGLPEGELPPSPDISRNSRTHRGRRPKTAHRDPKPMLLSSSLAQTRTTNVVPAPDLSALEAEIQSRLQVLEYMIKQVRGMLEKLYITLTSVLWEEERIKAARHELRITLNALIDSANEVCKQMGTYIDKAKMHPDLFGTNLNLVQGRFSLIEEFMLKAKVAYEMMNFETKPKRLVVLVGKKEQEYTFGNFPELNHLLYDLTNGAIGFEPMRAPTPLQRFGG